MEAEGSQIYINLAGSLHLDQEVGLRSFGILQEEDWGLEVVVILFLGTEVDPQISGLRPECKGQGHHTNNLVLGLITQEVLGQFQETTGLLRVTDGVLLGKMSQAILESQVTSSGSLLRIGHQGEFA